MEIKKIICKSGNIYNIINETWETSNAWGHKSTLLELGDEIASRKVQYHNRTWEMYTYQTSMSSLLNDILENNLKSYITDYKETNGISRLTKAKKDEVMKDWEKAEYIQDLKEIKERIRNRDFD